MLLILFLLSSLLFYGQGQLRNLDFEQRSGISSISPWRESRYSKGKYLVISDSIIKHSGRYSLRFSPDSLGKHISDGTVTNNIALDVMARKLKFTAWVLQSDPSDSAGFITCVVSQDLGERKTALMGKKIVQAKEWTQLTWEMKLDSFSLPIDHLRLNIGARGKSDFWVDDIKIEADGNDLNSLPSFASAAGEKIKPLSGKQINNLGYLCYTWGFLKYFHTTVAKGKLNWDMELFKMIPVVKQAGNGTELSAALLSWINSLGDPECGNCTNQVPDSVFKQNLDLAWMQNTYLSADLRNKLTSIINNRHRGNSYYINYKPVHNIEFVNENSYGNWREIDYPNELFRLQFLFRYWNTIQYFYPYKYINGEDWNDILRKFIPLFADAKDITSYHLQMTAFVNSVNDSHSGLTDRLVQQQLAPFTLPVKTTIAEGKLVVSAFKNDSLAAMSGLQIGDIIEKISGQNISTIIFSRLHLVNGSNMPVKLAYMNSYDYITGGKDSIVKLQIRRNDNHLTLETKRYAQIPVNNKEDTTVIWKKMAGNIGYVNMGKLEKKDVATMFKQLADSRVIIFDIRNYPRSTTFTICKYLYEKPTAFAKVLAPNPDFPGTFLWKANIVYGPVTGDSNLFHYQGKTVLLVNENTQSHAEWTAMALQAVPGSVTIGSQTSGADGDVSHLYLTGGYHTNMTGLGVFYPDGKPTQRVGVKVDIIVQPTVKSIREQRDEVLEKALEISKQ